MAVARSDSVQRHFPLNYEQPKSGKELHYPEVPFNEIADQLVDAGLGVRRDEADALANFVRALRDAIISCEGQSDMAPPAPFDDLKSCRSSGHKCRAQNNAQLYELRTGQRPTTVAI